MARRVQTKGQRQLGPVSGRRRAPRWQIERQRQRMTMAIGAVVLLFILALPVWGYITTFVLPPRQVVASINGEAILMSDLLKSLRVSQRSAEAGSTPLDFGTLPFEKLNTLIEEEVIRQVAPQLGVSVSPQEVDEEIRALFLGPSSDTDGQETEGQETVFQEYLREYLNLVQTSEAEFRGQVELDLLRGKAKEELGKEVPLFQPQIHLFRLSVGDEETLEQVQALFEGGTTFEALVEAYEVDETNKGRVGELGWLPKGLLGERGEFLFDLEVGMLSDPGRSEEGLFVFFMVKEKAEARELDSGQLEQLKRGVLSEWITEVRNQQDIESTFSSEEYDWLVKQLGSSSREQSNLTPS